MAAFCLFVCAYFLEPRRQWSENAGRAGEPPSPSLVAFVLVPRALRSTEWIDVSGPRSLGETSLDRVVSQCGRGRRNDTGCPTVHTIRRIVEEPDIAPSPRGVRWLPRFGNSVQTAVGQFCIRSLARSRQHRLILAFYLGHRLGIHDSPFGRFSPRIPKFAAGARSNFCVSRAHLYWWPL